jgi:hypothetical protein
VRVEDREPCRLENRPPDVMLDGPVAVVVPGAQKITGSDELRRDLASETHFARKHTLDHQQSKVLI